MLKFFKQQAKNMFCLIPFAFFITSIDAQQRLYRVFIKNETGKNAESQLHLSSCLDKCPEVPLMSLKDGFSSQFVLDENLIKDSKRFVVSLRFNQQGGHYDNLFCYVKNRNTIYATYLEDNVEIRGKLNKAVLRTLPLGSYKITFKKPLKVEQMIDCEISEIPDVDYTQPKTNNEAPTSVTPKATGTAPAPAATKATPAAPSKETGTTPMVKK